MPKSITAAQIIEIASKPEHVGHDRTIESMLIEIKCKQTIIALASRAIRGSLDILEKVTDPKNDGFTYEHSPNLITQAAKIDTAQAIIVTLVGELVPILNGRGERIEW
jgi:hypothetical protein